MIDVVVALLAGFGVACAALVGYQWLAGYRVFPFEAAGFPDPADPPYSPFTNRGIGVMDPRDAEDVSWSDVTYMPPAPPAPANEYLRFSVDGPAGRDLPLEEALSTMEAAADGLAHSLEALSVIPGPYMGAPDEGVDIGEGWPMEALITEAPWEEALEGSPLEEAHADFSPSTYQPYQSAYSYGSASNAGAYSEGLELVRRERLEALAQRLSERPPSE